MIKSLPAHGYPPLSTTLPCLYPAAAPPTFVPTLLHCILSLHFNSSSIALSTFLFQHCIAPYTFSPTISSLPHGPQHCITWSHNTIILSSSPHRQHYHLVPSFRTLHHPHPCLYSTIIHTSPTTPWQHNASFPSSLPSLSPHITLPLPCHSPLLHYTPNTLQIYCAFLSFYT